MTTSQPLPDGAFGDLKRQRGAPRTVARQDNVHTRTEATAQCDVDAVVDGGAGVPQQLLGAAVATTSSVPAQDRIRLAKRLFALAFAV